MSTFGKKAFIWWNYEDHSHDGSLRFNSTKKDIQLAILQKWYPIGSRCKIYYNVGNIGSIVYEIIGYTEHLSFWNLKVKSEHYQEDTKHPMRIVLDPSVILSIKRDNKLEKLNIK